MSVAAPKSLKHGSVATTHGYTVRVSPHYLKAESSPADRKYTFRYDITIQNESGAPAQLISRRWLITDAEGRHDTVEGDGVVGMQPTFAPGESFNYSSFCPLRTTWGTMEGAFIMQSDGGESFEITVARFYLVCNDQAHA